jgi:hypothetical protein
MTGTETAYTAKACQDCPHRAHEGRCGAILCECGTETAGEARPLCTCETYPGESCPTWCSINPAAPTEARGLGERVAALAKVIWHASRADESTISATGADIVARAVLDAGYVPGDSLLCCPECGSVFEAEDNTVVCDHAPELSAKRLAEAAAPETEGPVAPCSRKDAHDPHEHWDVPASEPGEYRDAHICRGIEPFPTAEPLTAQPAAEGAREDDGLATLHAAIHWNEAIDEQDECPYIRPDEDCTAYMKVRDWLAEDRRRARAEGGAEALEEAADDLLLDCSHFNRYRGKPEWCGYCESAVNMLRDRAAGLRETGVKG